MVEDVPSVFVFLVFEEFYCDSFLIVVGVVSSYWLEPVVFVFKYVKGDLLRSGGLKVRLAQVDCVGEFKGKGSGRVFGNDQR